MLAPAQSQRASAHASCGLSINFEASGLGARLCRPGALAQLPLIQLDSDVSEAQKDGALNKVYVPVYMAVCYSAEHLPNVQLHIRACQHPSSLDPIMRLACQKFRA